MKKFTLIMLIVFLCSFGVNGQKDLINPSAKPYHGLPKGVISEVPQSKGPLAENFEGTFPPAGWSLTTGEKDWAKSSAVDHTSGTGSSAIYDCYNFAFSAPAYLNTPEMKVTEGDATFTFWCDYFFVEGTYGSSDELYVDISSDGGATWTSGTTNYLSTILKDTWTQFSIDLSANIGQNVKLRFKAISNYGSYRIAIDDVAGPALNIPDHDLAVTKVTPSGLVGAGSSIIPKVTVTNNGGISESTYSVQLSDGGNYNHTVNSSTALPSFGNVEVPFPVWTPANGGYTLTATVTMAGDVVQTNNTLSHSVIVRDYEFGDVVMEFNTQSTSAVGVETDGANIYVQNWDNADFERYTMQGTYLNSFTISSASSIRDLAFDGVNFYGAPNSTNVYKLDFTSGAENLVGNITAPVSCRALAYDSDDNTFWGNSGSLEMVEFTKEGTLTGRSFTPSVSVYGAAYDNYSDPQNPTIWGSDWTGSLARLVEWKLDGTPTGREVDLTSKFTNPNGGGLAIYREGNAAYLLADFQTEPTNAIVKIFLALTPSSENDVLSFKFSGLTPVVEGTINTTAHTVNLEVPLSTNVTALVPSISVSEFATVSPANGVAQNFTNPVHYTVIAQDGTPQDWTVTVTKIVASSAKKIESFKFEGLTPVVTGIVNDDNFTVALSVPAGTDVTALVPTIAISDYAVITPASGIAQNFTNPVHYSVMAQDGSTQMWTVTVNIAEGISDVVQNAVRIYPNPANELVNVQMNSTIGKISIVNLNGQIIAESIVNQKEGSINTSAIANGIYFLRVETSEGVIMNKIQVIK